MAPLERSVLLKVTENKNERHAAEVGKARDANCPITRLPETIFTPTPDFWGVAPRRGQALSKQRQRAHGKRSGSPFSASKVGLRSRYFMPAAVVPSSKSSKTERGQSTKAVGGVGPSNPSHRITNAALWVTLLGGLLTLGGCSSAPSAPSNASTKSSICAGNPPRHTRFTDSTLSTLPPSHDNDVGRGRLPDLHPDADVDASQIPKAGLCQRY